MPDMHNVMVDSDLVVFEVDGPNLYAGCKFAAYNSTWLPKFIFEGVTYEYQHMEVMPREAAGQIAGFAKYRRMTA